MQKQAAIMVGLEMDLQLVSYSVEGTRLKYYYPGLKYLPVSSPQSDDLGVVLGEAPAGLHKPEQVPQESHKNQGSLEVEPELSLMAAIGHLRDFAQKTVEYP